MRPRFRDERQIPESVGKGPEAVRQTSEAMRQMLRDERQRPEPVGQGPEAGRQRSESMRQRPWEERQGPEALRKRPETIRRRLSDGEQRPKTSLQPSYKPTVASALIQDLRVLRRIPGGFATLLFFCDQYFVQKFRGWPTFLAGPPEQVIAGQ